MQIFKEINIDFNTADMQRESTFICYSHEKISTKEKALEKFADDQWEYILPRRSPSSKRCARS